MALTYCFIFKTGDIRRKSSLKILLNHVLTVLMSEYLPSMEIIWPTYQPDFSIAEETKPKAKHFTKFLL